MSVEPPVDSKRVRRPESSLEDRIAHAKNHVIDCKGALKEAERIYADLWKIEEEALSIGTCALIALYGPDTVLMGYETGRLMYERSSTRVPFERIQVTVSLSGSSAASHRQQLASDIEALLNKEVLLHVQRKLAPKVEHHLGHPIPGVTAMQCMRLHPVEPDKWGLKDNDQTSYITNSVLFGRIRSRDYLVWLDLFQQCFERDRAL